jgi:hypothetical protein
MSLIDILQCTRDAVFFDTCNGIAQFITYTPVNGTPTQIVAASIRVMETGQITHADDMTYQPKHAGLVLRQEDGAPFGIGDTFSFPIQPRDPNILNWLFRPGSSETNLDGSQYVEVIQIVPVEKGGNYRKQH